MRELPTKLVVRRAVSRGTLVLAVIAVLTGIAALCVSYELGRYAGGYDILAAAIEGRRLTTRADSLEKQNAALRRQVSELETMRLGHDQERAELARTIGALQSQVASQAQQIALYRGLVPHGAAGAEVGIGLQIQELYITAESSPGRYDVHLMLLETAHPQAAVKGTYRLSVEGSTRGKLQTIAFNELTGSTDDVEPFTFRYFKSVEVAIALPSGFSPQHVTVELRAGGKEENPLIQTFPWKVDAS